VVGKVVKYVASPKGRLDLPLDLRGTEFQKRVWRAVQKIPAGKTSTYSAIAEEIGAPKAVRAVASSCSRCWHAFSVPCHRVLHGGTAAAARRDPRHARRYRWVDYEAGFAPTPLPV
jgi:AraC family transcriptional regulator of adaptative response/methylated-DNA-[protein]-cysteine methyltransferase